MIYVCKQKEKRDSAVPIIIIITLQVNSITIRYWSDVDRTIHRSSNRVL